jgi:uncharacterized protein YaiI (UPF0178 family)
MSLKILVDADSCPRPARELALRTAERRGLSALFAANRPIPGIGGPCAVMEICPPGENSADNRIVELAEKGDIVITRDVPLAARLVAAGVTVIDDRGRVYTCDNIRELLSMRDFAVNLAESGLGIERSPSYGKKELKSFADSLDRELARCSLKKSPGERSDPGARKTGKEE